jgi:CHAD domain-containing protein
VPFHFKRKEPVAKAVRRLARELIQQALRSLDRIEELESIHDVRKDIKKMRAILRLVRDNSPSRTYRKFTRALRKAAAPLAGARDAHVKLQAFESLVAHFKKQISIERFKRFRAELEKNCREATRLFSEKGSANNARAIFLTLSGRLADLAVERKEWGAVCPGVQTSYRLGRRDYKAVLKDPSTENFHNWRKRVKDLWYQVRLLRPIWPEQMCALSEELKTLGEYLGDDHDLSLLKEEVAAMARRNGTIGDIEALVAVIDLRQRELRSAALDLGARVYSEKPVVFSQRLGRYWKFWRGTKRGKRRESPCRLIAAFSKRRLSRSHVFA